MSTYVRLLSTPVRRAYQVIWELYAQNRFNHLYERLSYFGLPEHVPELKKRLRLRMRWVGQVATHLLSSPDTDVDILLERALEYTGMVIIHAELKDRMSYERWMAAARNFEIPNGSPELQPPPRVLERVENGFQTDEYDEVYKLLTHYGLTMHINELKHRISIRTNYLETHSQGVEVVESSPISRLKEVLRYNGFHELLEYLEHHIAYNDLCRSRDVPIRPHKRERLKLIGALNSFMSSFFHSLMYSSRNPHPSTLALFARHAVGDHNEYIDAEDHGEHAAAGGVPIQLATAAAGEDHNEYIDAEDHGEHAAAGGVPIQLATAAAGGVPIQLATASAFGLDS